MARQAAGGLEEQLNEQEALDKQLYVPAALELSTAGDEMDMSLI